MGILRGVAVQLACFVPIVLVSLLILHKHRQWKAQSKLPFQELRRRPPGESLRLKLEELDENLAERATYFVAGPAILGIVGYFTRAAGPTFAPVLILASAIWCAVLGWQLYTRTRERANYQLGFDGERFVGEELNRLAALGFEVYHDLPFDGFNMDHVLVGPPGVFLVETKARRKPLNDSGAKEYHVEFDGNRLRWPTGVLDDYGISQAANNGRTLSQWLSGSVGEPVRVTPILTLPGWMVDRLTPSRGVHVLNPKEIPKICNTKEVILNDNLIHRICYQLDQKCKLEVG